MNSRLDNKRYSCNTRKLQEMLVCVVKKTSDELGGDRRMEGTTFAADPMRLMIATAGKSAAKESVERFRKYIKGTGRKR